MAHPILHSKSSAKKFGGKPEDYLHIHNWFDETKSWIGTSLSRYSHHGKSTGAVEPGTNWDSCRKSHVYYGHQSSTSWYHYTWAMAGTRTSFFTTYYCYSTFFTCDFHTSYSISWRNQCQNSFLTPSYVSFGLHSAFKRVTFEGWPPWFCL